MTEAKSNELEAEAVALVRKHRMVLSMSTPFRNFLIKLSGALGWNNLFQELK